MQALGKVLALLGVVTLASFGAILVSLYDNTIQAGTIDAFSQMVPVLMLIAIVVVFARAIRGQ